LLADAHTDAVAAHTATEMPIGDRDHAAVIFDKRAIRDERFERFTASPQYVVLANEAERRMHETSKCQPTSSNPRRSSARLFDGSDDKVPKLTIATTKCKRRA
jgi:hypothetical protein